MSRLASDDRGIIVVCDGCGQRNRLAWEHLDNEVRCGNCRRGLTAPAAPVDIESTDDFDHLVARSSIPVVVDYWAPWCGPCRMVAPELAKVAALNTGRLLVVKVNTDVLADLGARFGVRSIPTLAVFVDGREVARTSGARPAGDIEAFVWQAARAARPSPA